MHVLESAFNPAYMDPKDFKEVFTNHPSRRLKPIYDYVSFDDVLAHGFFLTGSSRIPAGVISAVGIS